jgi:hypothetical protein
MLRPSYRTPDHGDEPPMDGMSSLEPAFAWLTCSRSGTLTNSIPGSRCIICPPLRDSSMKAGNWEFTNRALFLGLIVASAFPALLS